MTVSEVQIKNSTLANNQEEILSNLTKVASAIQSAGEHFARTEGASASVGFKASFQCDNKGEASFKMKIKKSFDEPERSCFVSRESDQQLMIQF